MKDKIMSLKSNNLKPKKPFLMMFLQENVLMVSVWNTAVEFRSHYLVLKSASLETVMSLILVL